MTDSLAHRGPDDAGIELLGPIGLGHRRLRILDLSSRGHQPMSTADSRLTIVYNGEVYNFQELRRELEDDGIAFRSETDTEVVLQAYARWGLDAFERFNGMFALAIWEADTERLVLARDRFGIKPLYWASTPTGVVFGSEIKALLASGRVERRLDTVGLHEYSYYGAALGERTLFSGIEKLLPGRLLLCDKSGNVQRTFWSAEHVQVAKVSAAEAAREVRARLEAAVERHLIADVPVAVFLSGGIDSSAITALASRTYHGSLRTYSVGFDFDRGANELPKARRLAERLSTEHTELHLEGSRVGEVIEALVDCHDQPFGDAAGIPLYLLCQQLGESVKVVLQGDGGDEMFAGYRRYAVLRYAWLWRNAARVKPLLDAIAPRNPRYDRLARFLDAIGETDGAMRMARLLTQEPFVPSPLAGLSEDLANETSRSDPFLRYRELSERLAHLDPVQSMLHVDASILLPDIFCEKVDRTTMAHGIEVRVPFLDADLSSYAMSLPSPLKVHRGQKKWILRKALRGIVPDDVLDGPKTGFGVPYGYWLRDKLRPMLREVVLDNALSELFNATVLEKWIEEHRTGLRDHGYRLYKMLSLGLWYRRYIQGTPDPVV